jgi:peptidyl-prolyl cis-trans isomerase C
VSEQEIDEKLAEHKKRFGNDKAFEDYLNRTHNTIEELRNDIRYNQLRELLVDKISGPVAVTDEQVKQYYDQNTDKYIEQEQVKASHILIKLDKNEFLNAEKVKAMNPDERKKAEQEAETKAKAKAMEKAKKILAEVKKPNADFNELAKKYSEGPTTPKGGDLGYFTRKRMVKQFSDVAFGMKVGDISDIVETRFGLHIIKVFDHKKAVQKSFDEVKESIQKSLESRAKNEKRREVLKKIKDEIKVEVLLKLEEIPPAKGEKGEKGLKPGMHMPKTLQQQDGSFEPIPGPGPGMRIKGMKKGPPMMKGEPSTEPDTNEPANAENQ